MLISGSYSRTASRGQNGLCRCVTSVQTGVLSTRNLPLQERNGAGHFPVPAAAAAAAAAAGPAGQHDYHSLIAVRLPAAQLCTAPGAQPIGALFQYSSHGYSAAAALHRDTRCSSWHLDSDCSGPGKGLEGRTGT